MPYTVYGLSDPRTPDILRYVGRTSAHHKKRTSDHIAAARFREPDDRPPVMVWLAELDEQGIRAMSTVLGIYDSDAQAEQVESALIETFKGLLLNSPRGNTRSGRPVGSRDKPGAIERKKQAWEQSVQLRKRSQQVAVVRRRQELGYPYPELPALHPLNEDHYRARRGIPPRSMEFSITRSTRARQAANTKFRAWRVAMGFPNPNEGKDHRDNREWAKTAVLVPYEEWLRQQGDLTEAAKLLVPPGKELN